MDITPTSKVYGAICAVAADLAKVGISKDRKSDQKYSFRGIDDMYNALAPLLALHKLVILPRVLERSTVERTTRSGGALFVVTVKTEFVFVSAEDGSGHVVCTYGEAMDSSDKATNKAMSAAYKYAVMQAFCIPTEGDNDTENTTHEVVARPPSNVSKGSFSMAGEVDPLNPFKTSEARKEWMVYAKNELDPISDQAGLDDWLALHGGNLKYLGTAQLQTMNDLIANKKIEIGNREMDAKAKV